jgi:thioredoxin-related protein
MRVRPALFLCSLMVCSLLSVGLIRSTPPSEKIKWLTIQEAYALSKKEPRKILVDIYTDWCGWCKVMDRETYTDPKVIALINKKYYAVKFDAEQKEQVVLGNQKFDYLARGGRGVHELALQLTNNKPSYPTTVFLDEKQQIIQPLPGFLKAKEFHEILAFFGGDHYKKEQFDLFKSTTYPKLYK